MGFEPMMGVLQTLGHQDIPMLISMDLNSQSASQNLSLRSINRVMRIPLLLHSFAAAATRPLRVPRTRRKKFIKIAAMIVMLNP